MSKVVTRRTGRDGAEQSGNKTKGAVAERRGYCWHDLCL